MITPEQMRDNALAAQSKGVDVSILLGFVERAIWRACAEICERLDNLAPPPDWKGE